MSAPAKGDPRSPVFISQPRQDPPPGRGHPGRGPGGGGDTTGYFGKWHLGDDPPPIESKAELETRYTARRGSLPEPEGPALKR